MSCVGHGAPRRSTERGADQHAERETVFSFRSRQGSLDKQPRLCCFAGRRGSPRREKKSLIPCRLLFPQVWTFGDTSLSSGSSGRHSVQTIASDHGVVSSLVLSETLAQDFQLRYNCTAWNRFGTGTALVTLKEQGTGGQGNDLCLWPLQRLQRYTTLSLS